MKLQNVTQLFYLKAKGVNVALVEGRPTFKFSYNVHRSGLNANVEATGRAISGSLRVCAGQCGLDEPGVFLQMLSRCFSPVGEGAAQFSGIVLPGVLQKCDQAVEGIAGAVSDQFAGVGGEHVHIADAACCFADWFNFLEKPARFFAIFKRQDGSNSFYATGNCAQLVDVFGRRILGQIFE